MAIESNAATSLMDKPSQCTHEVLSEQLLWLIHLRWIAVCILIIAALLGSYVFPVLTDPFLIYLCAAVLLACNIVYFVAVTRKPLNTGPRDLLLGMIQVEADLVILTVVLNFSGGVVNPFFLFYIFHVIIAAIILPRHLSFIVGLTAILLFGLLEINEISGGAMLRYYPLQISGYSGLWRNPVYALGVFTAFSCTIILAQYLTRMIVTRMTAKELEAARNSDVLNAVINAMSEGLLFITNDGNVSICNPAAERWKRKSAETHDHSFEDFPFPMANMLKDIVLSDDKNPKFEKMTSFQISKPETIFVEVKGCPVISAEGKKLGYVFVGQDLTEHKKLEVDLRERTEEVIAVNEILKKSRVEMAQREKMVAVGQIASGIAHEIGNPLSSISSVSQYLAKKLTNHEQKEQLLIIQYHVNRISNILQRMLSLSRPATSDYKWIDINSLIDNTLSLISFDKRAQSVNIKNISHPDLPLAWLNPQHFEQVFLNVFINALDAMQAAKEKKEHVLKVISKCENDMLEIHVSDSGIGMSPEVCKRAFESFYSTKEIGKGTGLGLYISNNLVSEVDGTLELESEPGKGTTVIIKIPLRPKKYLIYSNDHDNINHKAEAV